jgi:hypothetical protein
MSITIKDFWCWDRLGVLVLIIAVPLTLIQIFFLFTAGIGSSDWFLSPLTSSSLLFVIFAFWYFGMYPVRCIERTLIPHVIDTISVGEKLLSAYLAYARRRRVILLIWSLSVLVIHQVVWMIVAPIAWNMGMFVGDVIFAWLLLCMLISVYLISTGLSGRFVTGRLQKRANPQFKEIFRIENEWMCILRGRQSM